MRHGISRAYIRKLAESQEPPAVSVYMPVQTPTVKNPEQQENAIRLKNLEREAAGALEQQGYENTRKLLKPLRDVREKDSPAWDFNAKGIACFLSPERAELLSLPAAPAERVEVGEHFAVRPLIGAFSEAAGFYILSLDQRCVQLLYADSFSISNVSTRRPLPSVSSVFAEYDFEPSLNAAPGARTGVRFNPEADLRSHLIEFLERVDETVVEEIGTSSLPVVLAGVEYIVGHYRKLTRLRSIVDDYVRGSPSQLGQEELHRRGREIVAHAAETAQDSALQALDKVPQESRLNRIEDILPAAYEGRAASLYVDPKVEIRGYFDPASLRVERDSSGEAESELLDLASALTLRNGGSVYTINEDALPAEGPAVAIQR